ncbi:hypothetical protein BJY52DRAFT_1184373 [Lactarius psammicola]|nr:hypothetical protein BJY52DRAFT_1184373 [Lactarius psammicola]
MLVSALIVWGSLPAVVIAAPALSDPCAAIAGTLFSAPGDTLACLKSFPFNETLRRNVLTTVSRVFDFYTFEDYYPKSSAPFPSTINIRAELARIGSASYATDYDFNFDLYSTINRLNDGHTVVSQLLRELGSSSPTPVVSISVDGVEGIYIASDAVAFISLAPPGFTSYYESIGFDWKRLAGARVLQIEGMDPYDYVDLVADTYFPALRFRKVGATQAETVTVPFLDVFLGNSFSDRDSYWANNCAANSDTNGVDRGSKPLLQQLHRQRPRKIPPKGITRPPPDAVGLPRQFQPSLPVVNTNATFMVSYVLPDGITGVLFVGSFEEPSIEQFQLDIAATITSLKGAGATRLLIDLTNNPGGFICEGFFLHQYLSGLGFGYPGFQSAVRGNVLAQKVVQGVIAKQISEDLSFYVPEQWAFLNDTLFPNNFDYISPPVPVLIDGIADTTSRRFHDACPTPVYIPIQPPFDLSQVAIVTNGNCASTCAMFSTLMSERHNTTIAVFGGRPGQSIEFKGMAGNQVLEWTDLDSEIKTAGLKNDPLAPPDLLVSANMRHNWRTAYSYFDEDTPIAYYSQPPTLRFPYTVDTYNNPQNLWIFASEAEVMPRYDQSKLWNESVLIPYQNGRFRFSDLRAIEMMTELSERCGR